jgi:hypothetical protein
MAHLTDTTGHADDVRASGQSGHRNRAGAVMPADLASRMTLALADAGVEAGPISGNQRCSITAIHWVAVFFAVIAGRTYRAKFLKWSMVAIYSYSRWVLACSTISGLV